MLYRAIAATLLLGCCATSALAVPVRYEFTTGTSTYISLLDGTLVPLPDSAIFAPLSGLAVSGSFYYDSDAPLSLVTSGGSRLYDVAFNQLSGSIGALTFSDGVGLVQVGDDAFTPTPPGPPVDILQLSASSASANDFVGGSVNGLQLINVRMFWIEGQAVPGVVPDFLSGPALPGALPSFSGRLSLDFGTPGLFPTTFLFRDDLIVRAAPAAVSEPESAALALLGLVALAAARRRARGALA